MPSTTSECDTRSGVFKYLRQCVAPSLFRNGQVLTRRNADGSDSEWKGVDLEPCAMSVRDARRLEGPAQRTLHDNGFELWSKPLADQTIDFLDHSSVVTRYYHQCSELVREASGASVVHAFDHNVRSATGKVNQHRISGGQQVQGPAHVVHGDYTLTSAPQRLRDLTVPPSGNDTLALACGSCEPILDNELVERTLQAGRFAIINVWRNIAATPVAVNPLALCDAARVKPDDLVVFEIHYDHRVGENYFARHSNQHDWYFFPEMTRDEALLIKQWDSAGRFASSNGALADRPGSEEPCTFSFHSAFDDPQTPLDAPDRWSIEVRCVAIYE